MHIPSGGIAFFDSGIGGLTVLNECRRVLQNYIFYYYGDNENAPYGNLSRTKILQHVETAFEYFSALSVQAVVLACNTVTAVCVDALRKEYSFPIIGAEPALLPAIKQGGDVMVLATHATRTSLRFQNLCNRAQMQNKKLRILLPECDNLAGIIERNMGKSFDYSAYLPKVKADKVVLGCTHYIYIKDEIARFYNCKIYDGNNGIKNRLLSILNAPQSANLQKSRDEQPPITPAHSSMLPKRDFCVFTGGKGAPVFFLGSGKYKNLSIYEQMFAIPDK